MADPLDDFYRDDRRRYEWIQSRPICPVCGNILWAMGQGSFSCCGVTLPPLEAEEPDEAHAIALEHTAKGFLTLQKCGGGGGGGYFFCIF